ncbi:MAG: hypothetical protein CL608_24090 [Anaerolineaceae bacterium]|nr:hypothetical protein [Anaerolineaceae bacterium]
MAGFGSQTTVAGELVTVDVIRNGFALGINNDHCPLSHDPDEEPINSAEWSYDEYISLSKCGASKNTHPYDLEIGGAMFKNGPIENSGFGLPNVPAHMWQVYDLAALGVPVGAPVTVDLTLEMVSVGGVSFTAVLETSSDGETWTPETTLIQWPQESCGLWKYPLYCGTAVVDYAPYYRLALTSVWDELLGQKWVVHHLNFTFEEDGAVLPTATAELTNTPTPTETTPPLPSPTATGTPEPLPTDTPTPTATAIPSFTIDEVTVEEGNDGIQNAAFVVSLPFPLAQTIVLDFETVAETAVANEDFLAQSGSFIFAAGEISQVITIPVMGDTEVEADETFCLKISYGSPSSPVSVMARAAILNDDKPDSGAADTFTIFLPFLIATK